MTTGTKIGIGIGVLALIGGVVYFITKKGGETVVIPQPQLTWIESKEISDWLQSKFDKQKLNELRGWLDLIKKERKSDSTKWNKSDEYSTQQMSDIAGALYQMGDWDTTTKFELQDLK
jgi:hypothetical protein